jgi:hypothetical protein
LICSSNHEGVIIIYKAPGTHPTPRVSMSVSTMFSAKAPLVLNYVFSLHLHTQQFKIIFSWFSNRFN